MAGRFDRSDAFSYMFNDVVQSDGRVVEYYIVGGTYECGDISGWLAARDKRAQPNAIKKASRAAAREQRCVPVNMMARMMARAPGSAL